MKNFTLQDISSACSGQITGECPDNQPLGEMVIDSRKIKPGDIFLAYKGERADGFDYIPAAFKAGAAVCISDRVPAYTAAPTVVAADVQKAVEAVAEAYRATLSLPIIGITGSVGKTTAKEMVYSVLSQKYNTLKTDGNYNNQIGLPMTISRIEPEHEAAVVEMGVSKLGDMALLGDIARPTIALFTNIGHAHLEFLGSLEGVFKEKTSVINYMPPDGTIIINNDDKLLCRLKRDKAISQKIITFGLDTGADITAADIDYLSNGNTKCTVSIPGASFPVKISAYGKQMVYAALAGAAAGYCLGLSADEIKRGIEAYRPLERRGLVTRTGFLTLIDDCYNANPDSMDCAIDSLCAMEGRKVCVLSDMLEQGDYSKQMHLDLGKDALCKGVDLILAYGPMSRYTCEGMGEKGIYFESKAQLIAALPGYIQKGDNVLVKASLGMGLEDAAVALKDLKG